MTEEQKKHVSELTEKAANNACQSVKELIDEFDDIISNNPDDKELSLEIKQSVLGACSAVMLRGLVTVETRRGFFLDFSLKLWQHAEEMRTYDEKKKNA